ncbi:hypothetical protein G9A89_001732 [Geosiphon pyriformis]|nr:hypothetical protein G9A89_001732 [Geosiphon pyriformis]
MQTDTPVSEDASNSNLDWPGRWDHINKLLNRRGAFCDESFIPGAGKDNLDNCKILVIGAGGLGCEILKNLAVSGFKNIHVIDMDTIDISNLNRQFLFRHVDVGRPKAIVAAEFVMKRVAGVNVTPFYGKIQDKDAEYYSQFQIVICGLDSVEARRWMNATIVEISAEGQEIIPLIDGGTEGFKGQARVIIPTVSSCYECSLDMLSKPTTFPICTIANTPRLPEHCIEWASVLEWTKVFPEQKLDTDEPQHIQWVLEAASARAKEFNITGVTYTLTQGVVKNIIPAIASTNAIIAAACCNEAFKLATTTAPYLNNYMMYTGNEGIYTYTFEHQKKPECPVCSEESNPVKVEVKKDWTLEEFIDWLKEKPDAQLKKPSLATASKKLYLQAPPFLEKATRPNLEKKLKDMVEENEEIIYGENSAPDHERKPFSFLLFGAKISMFKKFNYKEDVANQSQVKSSVQRNIRTKVLEQYKQLEPVIDEVLPKKTPLVLVKCHEHINLLTMNNEIVFFQHFDGPYYPTLRLLHKYPDSFPKVQVDRGAIKFILSGANIMCPGLTSKGGRMEEELSAGTIVGVFAEGKEHAIAIGLMKLSTQDIKQKNKGIGIDNIHYLNDPLWKTVIEV